MIDSKKMLESIMFKAFSSSNTIQIGLLIESALKEQGLEYKNGEIVEKKQVNRTSSDVDAAMKEIEEKS